METAKVILSARATPNKMKMNSNTLWVIVVTAALTFLLTTLFITLPGERGPTKPKAEDVQKAMGLAPKLWRNAKPRERYADIVRDFGAPDHISDRPGGAAVWNEDRLMGQMGTVWTKIELVDESVYHPSPAPHCDFLYATIRYRVPEEMIAAVMSISESLIYDQLKRELTARCHFMGANVATLYLATHVASGTLDIKEIKKNDLYGKAVRSTMDEAKGRSAILSMYESIVASVNENDASLHDDANGVCRSLSN
jgi:hypothetical protein